MKRFQFKLTLNHNQKVLIHQTIASARFVYNRFLALTKQLYRTEEKNSMIMLAVKI
ncbi:helix-turn-helix domain-containing protein [Nodularia harveyana UHCC-0300]|uniref:Helix-turn-helix domain-containing protein n=1 Tax=Nodularia harveyana UHCC-0300 TaxID=2974287 RepID=A0ABU5U8V4_9CYAN|nr:helix-turn-helix domain-containing protein [Nodularia harveyana]MEA5579970.1 helix-turn-helix domain-containing protein [Nodularia harveyana UHCC-0300]